MTQKNKQLIIFMKAPEPGKCKTRLIPFLSAEQACEFYKSLVNNTFKKINTLNDIDVALYASPDTSHPFIKNIKQNYNVALHKQTGSNLGERMHNAIRCSLKEYNQCILIGTDCPTIDAAYINKAFIALEQHDMVFGPAEDGGYVLIGATKIDMSLFENIDWGTKNVLKQSLTNINTAQYNTYLLDTLWDIDTPEDYLRYKQELDNT